MTETEKWNQSKGKGLAFICALALAGACLFAGFAAPQNALADDVNGNASIGDAANSTTAADDATKVTAQWRRGALGWWYSYSDGTYATGWTLIDKDWRYFDNAGWLQTGWVSVNNNWYYLYSSGIMATGWAYDRGSWYYLRDSGAMATGWLDEKGNWYYLQPSGAMATGWQNLGGTWYLMNSSGAMLTGWQKVDGAWYYLRSSGAMATGWQKVGNTWYYLQPSGAMATGWQNIGGTWYLLNGSGAMLTGWQKVGDTWYYLEPSGAMATGWAKVDGTWYYLEPSGAMASNTWISGTYWLLSNGAMAENAWVDNGQYWVGADGRWVPDKTPGSESSNTTTPQNGTTPMTAQELEMARQIFDAYNNYRAQKNLSQITWNSTYATWGYQCAKSCASHGELIHYLGIPADQQSNHADILQFVTPKPTANEVITRWRESTYGHRQMMQCVSTTEAGVGVYVDASGKWWIALVYDFTGTNQSGN